MIHFIRFHKRSPGISAGVAAIILATFCAKAETNRVILQEDFESFITTKAMRATWPGGPGQMVTNAPGGGQAASHDGTGMNRRSGFFVFPDTTHNLVLQADFYDFATNAEQNVLVSLNGEDTHDNVAIGLKGVYCYVARVGGFSSQTNWIPFKRGQMPVPGWHRFKATISATNVVATLDLGTDGAVDYSLDIPFNRPPPTFTQIRFGGYSGKLPVGGTVLVDNIKLELVSRGPLAITSSAPPETAGPKLLPVPPAASPASSSPRTNPPASSPAVPAQTAIPEDTSSGQTASPIAGTQAFATIPVSTSSNSSQLASTNPVQQAPANPALPTAVWWICGALAVIIALLGAVILMLRSHAILSPKALLTEGTDTTAGSGDKLILSPQVDDDWRKRALQAESVAARQAQILGEKVGPELVEFAKQNLVQGLYTQRNALLETQLKAKQTLVELDARLSELHLPANERIQAYEKRIGELEKELESRGDEMRELTRATLMLVQRRLEQERQQQGPRFN